MDIRKIISIASSIPRDKLKTDAGLKEVIREIGKKTGRSLTDAQLDDYVGKVKSMVRNETPSSLLNKLSKKGISSSDLNEIKKRFKK